MVDSGKPDYCIAKQFLRFEYGRMETIGDGCVLQHAHDAMTNQGGNISEMMRSFTRDASFKLHKVAP
jgi:hypothetical protein